MCGIAGFYAKKDPLSAALLERMTQAIVHRGPDDQGYFGVGPHKEKTHWKKDGAEHGPLQVGLGFRRLAILDLSENGAQPMTTDDERFWIVYNGELYNFPDLKRELEDLTFRSQSDTEVLLKYFARFGASALGRLNGIFAFAILDRKTGNLTVARDPLGVKPLYYFEDERGFFFASEIRALLKAKGSSPSLRHSVLSSYLLSNWVPDPDTLFDGIYRLEPGHFLTLGPGAQTRLTRYWDFAFAPDDTKSLADWTEALSTRLDSAVARQIRSDVPVGFFLSGGVDSSLLAAKAAQALAPSSKPSTFTIGFRWARSSHDNLDLDCARMLKEKFPFDYHELILDPSIVSVLPKVVECLEEPIADPAALCSYLICEAASEQFTVMISGQGGDELFGGYPSYPAGWLVAGMQRLPSSVLSLFSRAVGSFAVLRRGQADAGRPPGEEAHADTAAPVARAVSAPAQSDAVR